MIRFIFNFKHAELIYFKCFLTNNSSIKSFIWLKFLVSLQKILSVFPKLKWKVILIDLVAKKIINKIANNATPAPKAIKAK